MTYGIVGYLGHQQIPDSTIQPAWNPAIVSAFDVSLVAPDIICIEVRDAQIIHGSIHSYGVSQGTYGNGVHVTNPATGLTEYGRICGDTTYVRFTDQLPTAFLDRPTADLAANYSTSSLGGLTVTNVYRISKPWDSCLQFTGTGASLTQSDGVSMAHQIYLKLSGNLAAGSKTIVNSAFPTITFTYNDKSTRACSIHATQLGYRAAEAKKIATLSHWIPGFGTEGRIDVPTAYSLSSFSIINSVGTVVFTGTTGGGQMAATISPTTAETTIGLFDYPSTTIAPKVMTAITKANPGVVTITGHGYTAGQKKILRGLGTNSTGGMKQLNNVTITVGTVVDANNFQLKDSSGVALNTSGYDAFVANPGLASGYQNLCYDTFQANRAATYVYSLDFSAWTSGTPGTYYVYIPGLGVSYPFQIGESVHYQAAKTSMKGLYNQSWGIALDPAIGGVSRGVNYRDGVNGRTIFRSKLPAVLGSESNILSGSNTIDSGKGAYNDSTNGHWLTTTQMTGWYGQWHDAGDWDMQVGAHALAVYSLLEWGYEQLPSAARSYNMGYPRMTTLLDPTTYAGTDSMGDAVHAAIFYLDVLRRFQDVSGAVISGFQYSDLGGGGSGGLGGTGIEPSDISPLRGYCMAPDHVSNYWYAGAAAKAAIVFNLAGFTTLGTLWQNSAVAAWDFAEALYQDYKTNGVTGTTFAAYYGSGGTLDIPNNAFDFSGVAWTTAHYNSAMAEIATLFGNGTSTNGVRRFAAGLLYRLVNTGAAFTKYCTEIYNTESTTSGTDGIGIQEYIRASNLSSQTTVPGWGKNGPAQITYYPSQILNGASNAYLAAHSSPYPFMENFLNNSFSPGDPAAVLYAFNNTTPSQTNSYLKVLGLSDFWFGANQENLSCTQGIGTRYSINPLIRDREFAGLTSWPGVTEYTWIGSGSGNNPFNFQDGDATSNFTVDRPTSSTDPRIITPFYQAFPQMQAHFDTTYNISHTEFTTQQSIIPTFLTSLWRWAWDGNTATTL